VRFEVQDPDETKEEISRSHYEGGVDIEVKTVDRNELIRMVPVDHSKMEDRREDLFKARL
jgi:hypothetical protein